MAEQRYRVLERLEAGGMAEVFRGVAISVQGFKKSVAIKRVLPHLSQNKQFITMFLDEARLGARLNHGNIVSVFDIGSADSTYFIVMEYVDGSNLKRLMKTLSDQGRRFPTNEALYIGMEACRGLSYAHELTDEDGTPLHLVHRDVSPPNIMITKRGEVKLTDFGLAKATTQLEKTDPGVVKGKFSYLSPEAASGQEVDARADVFALGVVLWEMLAGRRLFLGENDYQTVKLVQQANIPSLSRLNPEVTADLETLLGRILARDPNERFSSARELGDALAGYLFSHQRKVTSYDLANLLASTVGVAAAPSVPSTIDRLIQDELQLFTSLEEQSEVKDLDPSVPLEIVDTGAHPLDASAFENPAEWFTDDIDLQSLPLAESTPQEGLSGSLVDFSPMKREHKQVAGLANLLEDDTQRRSLSEVREQPTNEKEHVPVVPTGPLGKTTKKPSSSWKWLVLVGVLLAGAGLVALKFVNF